MKPEKSGGRDRAVSTWMLVVGTLVAAIVVMLLVFDLATEGRISAAFGAAAVIYALLYITLVKQFISPPEPPAGGEDDEGDLNGGSP